MAFKGVLPEGLEVAIIVVTFGAAARAFPSAALAAAAALVVIGGAGALARRAVERIPRSALQLLVGTLLSAFGTFWAVEGLAIAWPAQTWPSSPWPPGTSSPLPPTSTGCGGMPGMLRSSLTQA